MSAADTGMAPGKPWQQGISTATYFRWPKACFATIQVPRNAKNVTKTAVGMVEPLPSVLLNLASGPQIAVMDTATHMAVIASDAHSSGISRSDAHRGRS
jgi:hypothetical protein